MDPIYQSENCMYVNDYQDMKMLRQKQIFEKNNLVSNKLKELGLEKLEEIIIKMHGVIYGSFIIQCILNEKFKDSDIDIAFIKKYAHQPFNDPEKNFKLHPDTEIDRYLVSIGGIYQVYTGYEGTISYKYLFKDSDLVINITWICFYSNQFFLNRQITKYGCQLPESCTWEPYKSDTRHLKDVQYLKKYIFSQSDIDICTCNYDGTYLSYQRNLLDKEAYSINKYKIKKGKIYIKLQECEDLSCVHDNKRRDRIRKYMDRGFWFKNDNGLSIATKY